MRLQQVWILAVVLALGLGVGLLIARYLGQPAPVTVQLAATTSAGEMRVYVSGAVEQPGVYPLRAGARVVDAVEAAGGVAPDADTEAINFALRLRDEEHIHVPRVGDPPASVPTAAGSPVSQRIDINHADAALIRSLPGVGATRAANIVSSRQKDGPFKRTEDLVQRKLLTQSGFEKVKDLIEASQAP